MLAGSGSLLRGFELDVSRDDERERFLRTARVRRLSKHSPTLLCELRKTADHRARPRGRDNFGKLMA